MHAAAPSWEPSRAPRRRHRYAALTGAELREKRQDFGVTQRQLADRLGMCTRTLQRWESGATPLWDAAIKDLITVFEQLAEERATLTGRWDRITW